MKETEQTLLEIPDIISSLSIPSVGPTEFEQKCRWLREQMDLYATAKAQASCEELNTVLKRLGKDLMLVVCDDGSFDLINPSKFPSI